MPYADARGPTGYDNMFLYYRNTFHWDKVAYSAQARDYQKARITHWLHNPEGQTSPIVESTKEPLESRIWHKYPGQYYGIYEGSTGTAIGTARVLDDGSTQETRTTYNPLGLPLTNTDPLGRKTVYTYAANHIDVLTIQQQVGTSGALATVASYTYNSQHLPLTSTDAAGQTTRHSYDAAGRLTSTTDPLGRTTTHHYDTAGRLTSTVNANGAVQESRTYDTLDRLLTKTDSEGHTVTYAYDAFDRVTQIAYPNGTTTEYGYTRLDRTTVKDRMGRVTRYACDANRRLVSSTDPLGGITRFEYFANDALRSITDPKGNKTSWEIDIQGRPISKRFADGSTEHYSYEATTSRLKSVRDALGQTRHMAYYADDQLKSLSYAGAIHATAPVTFSYDKDFPRRTSMVDGLGTTTWTYHPIGAPGAQQLATEDGPYAANDSVAYTYDALGREVRRSVDSAVETSTYDTLGRLASHTSVLGTFHHTYLGQTDQLTSRLAADGKVGTHWTYEQNHLDRRLKKISNLGLARSFDFTTTPEDLITGIAESVGNIQGKTWSYRYDAASRLLGATPSTGKASSYGYDAADNLVSITNPLGNRTATTNALNQLASVDGVAYRYDANGNVLDDGLRTYRWDAENRLIGLVMKKDTTQRSEFKYDGLGRRLAIVDTTVAGAYETRYLWCGRTICQGRTVGDLVSRRYFKYGVQYPHMGLGLFYGLDQLGSVRDLSVIGTGTRIGVLDYDAYGESTSQSTRLMPDFRFSGLYFHGLSGLHLASQRPYDSRIGRWLTSDPLFEPVATNAYSYVDANPLQLTDPVGLAGLSASGSGGSPPPGAVGGGGPFPQSPFPGPSACSYYDKRCHQSCREDRYACEARKCCESFGNDFFSNCTRKCLITQDEGACAAKSPGPSRNSCRQRAHYFCYAACFNVPEAVISRLGTVLPPACRAAADAIGGMW